MRRLEREERLLTFIQQGRAVRSVAALEGIDHDYAWQLMKKVAEKHGLEFHSKRSAEVEIHGLTEESMQLRARLADQLFHLQKSQSEIARAVGLKARAQSRARERPYQYDWTISEMERLARANGMSFRELMLKALLDPIDLKRVQAA